MSVTIHLHPMLYALADHHETVETSGSTVGECLRQAIDRYPRLGEMVFYKDGTLQTFIEIYVNRKVACPDELSWPVQDGDRIHLIVTIAGG
jgi:molybdopterin converting factor small subunit